MFFTQYLYYRCNCKLFYSFDKTDVYVAKQAAVGNVTHLLCLFLLFGVMCFSDL